MKIIRKYCTSCFDEKPIEAFYVNKSSKDGHSSKCKVCSREYACNRSVKMHEEFNALKADGLLKGAE